MKKISLLGANLDTGNMGVGALLIGAITCIKHAWPDAEISLLDYDDHSKSFTCRIDGAVVPVEMLAFRFSKRINLPNNIAFLLLVSVILRLLPSRTLRNQIMRGNTCLHHLQDTDMVLSIAGGDSFSDIYGQGRFIYIALPLLLAVMMAKKIICMPQTIGPFKSHFARHIAAYIMKHSALVYARDNESLLVAKKLMGKRNAVRALFCYDMGFVLNAEKPTSDTLERGIANKREKLLVGLNISGLLCIGGYNKNNMFALKIDYSELMQSLIHYLIEVRKTIVMLVPHVFGAVPESDMTAATSYFNKLTGRFGADLLLVHGDYDQNEIKYIIGQCDFFIGSRMHACIAALSQGIPAVGIAYSRKFAGVMQSIGMENLIADPRTNPEIKILEIIGKALDVKDKWAGLLGERLPHIKHTVLSLLDEKPQI